jgi:hypothetical protein
VERVGVGEAGDCHNRDGGCLRVLQYSRIGALLIAACVEAAIRTLGPEEILLRHVVVRAECLWKV